MLELSALYHRSKVQTPGSPDPAIHGGSSLSLPLPLSMPSARPFRATTFIRSEEHTSELQSLMRISYAVFCLKKKNKDTNKTRSHIRNSNIRTTATTDTQHVR